MTAREEHDLALRIGRLEGAVESGFRELSRRLDEMQATMLRLHDSQTEKREKLAADVEVLTRWRSWVLGAATAISAAAGLVAGWIGGGHR
ncbi:MAG: hypothetical protein QJR08_03800 [Bacillota bacterium]|nr:hypothetical protein [Bacillota bacterium]